MYREGKHNIKTNKTIRYGGNIRNISKYDTTNIGNIDNIDNIKSGLHTVQNKIYCVLRNEIYQLKLGIAGYCLKCGGSRYSCKAIPNDMNQYSRRKYKGNRKNIDKNISYLINDIYEF